MTARTATGTDRCATPKCNRKLDRTAIVANDGRRFCRHHGDHLPPFLRRPPRPTKKRNR